MSKSMKPWTEKWEEVFSNGQCGMGKAIVDGVTESQNFLEKYLFPYFEPSEQTILEIGCGNGQFLAAMSMYGPKALFGTDISKSALKLAAALLEGDKSVKLKKCSGLTRSFIVEQFDLIYAISVFQHLPKWQTTKYIKQVFKLLKPSGILFFNIMNPCAGTAADATIDDFDPTKIFPTVHATKAELDKWLKDFDSYEIKFLQVGTDPLWGSLIVRAIK